jgi:hypothetical protein
MPRQCSCASFEGYFLNTLWDCFCDSLTPPPQVEQAALKKEKDPLSQARLGQVEVELAQLQEQLSPLQIRWGGHQREG